MWHKTAAWRPTAWVGLALVASLSRVAPAQTPPAGAAPATRPAPSEPSSAFRAPVATQPATAPIVASQPTSRGARDTWLRVTRNEANLRVRPDTASVVVMAAPRRMVLHATGQDDFGWYRIYPPAGVFSYVSADHIERQGASEGVVAVQSGSLRVRVGSLVRELDPLQSEVHALLERGTRVTILGEQNGWLKIVPPATVRLYVSGDVVEPISAELAETLLALAAPATQNATTQSGVVAPATTTAAASRPAASRPAGPDLGGRWGQRLVDVEAAIAVESRKALLDQTWSESIARLRPIAEQREEPMVAQLAVAWIAQLEDRAREQQTVRESQEIVERAERDRVRQERELDRIDRARQAATRPDFTARGALLRSYTAADKGPRRYKLVDPLTQRLEAYIEIAADAKLDPEALLGQYVGVRGTRQPERGLGADVIQVVEFVVLPSQPVPPPVRATTQPVRPASQPTPPRTNPAARQGS